MAKDWIESREANLVTQAQDVSEKISANPVAYSLQVSDATALADDVTAYVDAYEAANDPATRTPVSIEEKDVRKAALVARMRSVGGRIRANPAVSNALKLGLGLHLKDTSPTPVPVPDSRPVLVVVSVNGRTIRARIADEDTPNLRSKPAGVAEYEVFTFVGETAPADLSAGWTYQGQGRRSVFEVTLPATVASGSKVWVAARWCNQRGAAGPASAPVAAIVVGTVAEAA